MHIPYLDESSLCKLSDNQLLKQELSLKRRKVGGITNSAAHLALAPITLGISTAWVASNLVWAISQHHRIKKEIRRRGLDCLPMRGQDKFIPAIFAIMTLGVVNGVGDIINDAACAYLETDSERFTNSASKGAIGVTMNWLREVISCGYLAQVRKSRAVEKC